VAFSAGSYIGEGFQLKFLCCVQINPTPLQRGFFEIRAKTSFLQHTSEQAGI